MRVAPGCIVCLDPVVVAKGTMCGRCCEAYDRALRRDSTTLGIIRWAAQRARRMFKLRQVDRTGLDLAAAVERAIRCTSCGETAFHARECTEIPGDGR